MLGTFLAALGEPERSRLESLIALRIAEARARWTSFEVAEERFVAYVVARVPEGASVDDVARMHWCDLYVACACVDGDSRAVAAFDATYASEIRAGLERRRVGRAAAEEIQQALHERLLVGASPRIADYAGRGPLGAWLRVTAVRAAFDADEGETRRRARETAAGDQAVAEADAELAHLKRIYGAEVQRAIREGLAALGPRERNLLRQHHIDGLTLDQVARLYRVARVTASRWVIGARQALREATVVALKARLQLRPDELESLLGLVQSQLDLSLRELDALP